MSEAPVNQKVLQELSDGLRAQQTPPSPAEADDTASQVVTDSSASDQSAVTARPKAQPRQAAAKSVPAKETTADKA